jgi:hypothetical protein
VSVQTTSASSASAINHLWHPNNQTASELAMREMLKSLEAYSRLGLPGCVGSMNTTYIPWDRIPENLYNLCKGNKGLGLLYQCTVTYSVIERHGRND